MSASNHHDWLSENNYQMPDKYHAIFARNIETALAEQENPDEQQINTIRQSAYDYVAKIREYEQGKAYAINQDVIKQLTSKYQFKEKGDELAFGICPDCDKQSLSTPVDNPMYVRCKRTKKCGYAVLSQQLFPELFSNLDKHYPASEYVPTATADVYLAVVKGFDIEKLAGHYSQHTYHHPHGNRGTATVRFHLNADKTAYWEQLLDEVTVTHTDGRTEMIGTAKSNTNGHWWMNAEQCIEDKDKIYLTESIFDAIALNSAGLKAVALLSSKSLPKAKLNTHFNRGITWVLTLPSVTDTRKHVTWLKEQGEKVTAMRLKSDLNDLHHANKLTTEDIRDYRYYGKLELVSRALDKAQLIYDHSHQKENVFVFNHYDCMYSCVVTKEKYDEVHNELSDTENSKDIPKSSQEIAQGSFSQAAKVSKLSNCTVELLYVLENSFGDDPFYCLRVDFENGTPFVIISVTGSALSSAAEFNKALFVKAPGAHVKMSSVSLRKLLDIWLKNKLMKVNTLEYAGYNKQNDAYIFNSHAVQNGKIIEINSDDYFALKNGGMKTSIELKQQLTTDQPKPWYDDFKAAYGINGLVALTWWTGSFFAEQIRADYRSYPFLEIIGEAGSGKTDLESFLWKLTGRLGDNFNPNSSSFVGICRKLAQVSCMPVSFNETDNETTAATQHIKKFNWDHWKALFNGEIDRQTGVKTNDNSTRSSPFRAALCVIQNIAVYASEAILSRFVHLQIDRAHHTASGKLASDRLNRLDIKEVSGFFLHALSQDKAVLAQFAQSFELHVKTLSENDAITMHRIMENHAMLMALADCLPLVCPATTQDVQDVHNHIMTMAENRQQILKKDNARVELFWENFNLLNSRFQTPSGSTVSKEHCINHDPDPDNYISVNLREYFNLARHHGYEEISSQELKTILVSSIEYEFIESGKVVQSRLTNKSVRCHRFKTPELVAREFFEAAAKKAKRQK